MGYFVYCRISKDTEHTGKATERQEEACRELAEREGLEVTRVFVDDDLSAYNSKVKRPAFEDMLKRIGRGETDGIICWHLDRLYRRTVDLERLVQIIERNKIDIRTVKAGLIDLSTPTGRMNARIVATMATYEVEHAIERQLASEQQRAAEGVFRGGNMPLGYMSGGTGKLAINQEEAAIVRELARRVLDGESLLSISGDMQARGVKARNGGRLATASIRGLLLNPTIAGISHRHGKYVGEGQWEAIISKEDHFALRDLLNDPSRRTNQGRERRWQGAGVYECGKCGTALRARKNKRTGYKIQVYACPAKNCVTVDQEDTDEAVSELIIAYLSRPENQISIAQKNGNESDTRSLMEKRDELNNRKNRLGRVFAQGLIDEAQLVEGTKEIAAQMQELERKVSAARLNSPVTKLVLAGDVMAEVWELMSPDERAEVIRTLMRVRVMPAKIPRVRTPVVERLEIEWK